MRSYSLSILTFITLLIFISCRKISKPVIEQEPTENTDMRMGLPPDPSSIHGYLYSAQRLYAYSSGTGCNVYDFAGFGEPARNLTSNYEPVWDNTVFLQNKNTANVSVGEIAQNGIYLNHSSVNNQVAPFIYNLSQGVNINNLSTQVEWEIEGNKSFPGLKTTLPFSYPAFVYPDTLDQVSRTSTVTISLSEMLPEGFDSAFVMLQDNNSPYTIVKKRVAANDAVIKITPKDLSSFSGPPTSYQNAALIIGGCKYCYQVANGKTYLFCLYKKFSKTIVVSP